MQGGRAADGQGYPAYLSEHQSDVVTAITHTGEKKILIHSLDREQTQGYIARTIADLTLQLYLKDTDGHERYKMEFNDYMTASVKDNEDYTAENLAYVFCAYYERPAATSKKDLEERAVSAEKWYSLFCNKNEN